MEVEDLADFMFKKNTNNAKIELELNGIENKKDLFCFFVDLLCKGLVLLHARESENNKLDIDSLTIDQYKQVAKKMANANICANVGVVDNVLNRPSSVYCSNEFPDTLDLKDYAFIITTNMRIYMINFEVL